LVWTGNKDAVSFYSHEVLPPDKTLKAIVKVGFEQWKDNKWSTVYTSGQKAEELMEVTFTTGTAPDVIPLNNVDYAYPVVNQKFFLTEESNRGFVQLKRGQSYLFTTDYKYEVQFTKPDGTYQAVPFAYNSSNNRIDYSLPGLSSQQNYGFDIVLLNKAGTDQPSVVTDQQNIGTEDDEIILTNKKASSIVRNDLGKSLLDYDFSTSRHSTFARKIESVRKGSAVAGRLSSDVIDLRYDITEGESFEIAELSGTEFTGFKPLVTAKALLTDDYFKEDIYPFNYKTYPVAGLLLARDTTALGFPPVKSIPVSTAYLTEVENNNFNGLARQRFPYIYNLPQIYKEDFVDLQHKIVNRFLGTAQQSQYNYMINGYYKFIRSGYYKVRLQYVLPDGTVGTNADFDFYNFIK
jgi:hypothetical protein